MSRFGQASSELAEIQSELCLTPFTSRPTQLHSDMESTSRLCDIISGHLLPYLEPEPARLTLETERHLLLSLTLVRREIQQWTSKSSSKPEMGGGLYTNHCCHESLQQTFVGKHRCLYNIISAVVAFLNADSHFICHAASKVLLSISSILIKHECFWIKFLQLIWFVLEDAMPTIFSSSELSPLAGIHADDCLMLLEPTSGDIFDNQNLQFSSFIALLRSRLLNVNHFLVVHLFQTLRNILKSLKYESGDLEEVFIQYAISSLIKLPWVLLIEIFSNCHASKVSFQQLDESRIRSLTEKKNLLLGAVLQLCCSIVKGCDFEADDTGPFKVISIYFKFSDLIPKLLTFCFINHLGNGGEFLFEYLRHKSLIMMIRLSFYKHWKNSYPESWLKLLNQYFGEILRLSCSRCDTGSEIFLEESPFFASTLEGGKFYGRHLQRKAIFLMLKCSFSIACVGDTYKECVCKEETTSSSFGFQLCRKHCNLGLLGTFEWLQRCCPLDKFQDYRNYSDLYSSFAISFMQLYMEEDDMLFKMLLLLLDTPFSEWQKEDINESRPIGANKHMLYHLSSIFCPIGLFHLFLFLLHYDHLVLVDYLISKDTGIYCLQYLLRCLRLIHKSWPGFMQFSIFGKFSDHCHKKRRKIPPAEDGNINLLSSTNVVFRRKISRRHNDFQQPYEISDSQTFENAKECLHSLNISLGELQRKKLFPYNSKPLLRSLARFLELCDI